MNTKVAILFCFFLLGEHLAFGQTWTLGSGAPTNKDWSRLVVSATGSNAVACTIDGLVYRSTNSGRNWQAATIVSGYQWQALASSADGAKLFIAAFGGPMYSSTNSGVNWNNVGLTSRAWGGVAMTPDGNTIIAIDDSSKALLISTNGGTAWLTNYPPSNSWAGVAISGDATKIMLVPGSGTVYTSPDGGNSWASNTINAPIPNWGTGVSSIDGTRLLVGVGGNGGAIYTSTNSGGNWVSNNLQRQVWSASASSSDGTRLLVGGYPLTFLSTNGGNLWTSNTLPSAEWSCAAMSADGATMFVAGFPGAIYALQTTPAPQLKLAANNSQLAFAWTQPSSNFALQQSPNLTGTNWSDVSNTPTLDLTNLQYQVTVPLSNSSGFFRLITQ